MKNILTLCTLFLAGPIAAFSGEPNCDVSLDVRFLEGAPVDRFVLTNGSDRGIIQADVQFDLRPSAGKLIFDTQSGGSGVEVYQPFTKYTCKSGRRGWCRTLAHATGRVGSRRIN